jgi:multiple sugar transport system substrate-binding protein
MGDEFRFKHPEEAWELIKFITSREMELKWFRDNRVLSSRKDVSNTASEILNDKFARVISSQLPNARLVPQIKQWPEIIQAVSMATYDAINETKTPEEALHEAHLKVEAIMKPE